MKISNWYGVSLIAFGITALIGEYLLVSQLSDDKQYILDIFFVGVVGLILVLTLFAYRLIRVCTRHNINSLEE